MAGLDEAVTNAVSTAFQAAGEITLARRGVAALTALKQYDQAGELAPGIGEALAGWPGWGPLAKALNYTSEGTWQEISRQLWDLLDRDERETARNIVDTAFYTPPLVVRAVWQVATGLGFTGGRILEPGCGAGGFIAACPPGLTAEWTGVEADQASARIAGLLHPQARIIPGRLEKTPLRLGSFDLAIGNVPFAKEGPYDPAAPKGLSLHNYFIWRALSAVRPGGLVVLVTSRWTLDASDPAQREELGNLGAFLGAIRLPGAALAPGGTRAITDIIAFRRHYQGRDYDADERWSCNTVPPDGLQTPVNTYFRANPGQVLGELRDKAGLRYGMTLDVALPDGADLTVMLDDAVAWLVKDARSIGLTWRPAYSTAEDDDDESAGDPARDGAFTLHGDGTITRQQDGRHEPVKPASELVALIRLRDAATALFAAEADQGISRLERGQVRDRARGQYKAYVAQFGPLNRCDLFERPDPDGEPGETIITRRRPAMGGFRADPDYVTVLALEVWNDDTQTASPAPILLRHVNAPAQRKTRTEDPAEALLLCLDETGHVDLDVIARLLATTAGAVPGLLDGQIWQDPQAGGWVTADEYLSGNVRAKLAAARQADAADPGRWDRHVTALAGVQPADLGPEDISAQLGSPWIPPDAVKEFIAGLLAPRQSWMHQGITVRYVPLTAQWEVRASTEVRKQPAATAEWGTLRVNAVNLIEDALNGTTTVIYDKGPGDTRIRNQTETALAADKIRDLQERFAEWLWEDPARADAMARAYNDRFNCARVRSYDGSLLSFPGMTGGFTPYPSQRDMVWRAVCTPAALCGHTVGAGKTAIMVMTAMTLRRLGLARKPCMIVPNHLLEQETAEARRLYPGARILMVTREDLSAERRRAFAAKVGARDWDLILMTHQQFMALPVSNQIQADYLAGLIEELDEALSDGEERTRTAKQLAARRKKLTAQHEELLHAPRDQGVTFEQTGIDYLMVDEAHYYKNLAMSCRAEGFSTSGSKRADDLAMKLGWLRDRNPDGRCGMLLTGTPISNSLSELHVLFRYLAPGALADLGLTSFDGFAGQYIRYATQTEVAPDGSGFRQHRRPVQYCNLPELRAMLGEIADIRTRADLQLAGPQVCLEHVTADPQPELAAFTAKLVERADKIRTGGVNVRDDNMLAVCGDGRRAALDLRLVGITPGGPGKIDQAASRIAAEYHATRANLYSDPAGETLIDERAGGFQLVFCDQGTPSDGDGQVYGRLRAALTNLGVPPARVAFIHEAKSHGDRSALFARCRSGDIAVLIASTEKAGTGVNIQHRMTAIHHLDAPWRPADVEQRDGRGDRPGNENPELRVTRYVTERSFDAYMWQALERKKRFIDQILTGDLDVREADDGGNPQLLSYGELKALATGQPLLLELSKVNGEIARLRRQSSAHKRTQARMYHDWQDAREQAQIHAEHAAELDTIGKAAAEAGAERALKRSRSQPADGGQDIPAELTKIASTARDRRAKIDAGQYRGIQVWIEPAFRADDGPPRLTVYLAARYWSRYPQSFTSRNWRWTKGGGEALQAELDAAIDAAGERAADRRQAKAASDQRAKDTEPYLNQEWPHKQELAALVAERVRITAEIDAQVKPEPGREEAKAA